MTSKALAQRTPETALQHVEDWGHLSPEDRNIRAAQILQDNDPEKREAGLAGLLQAYLYTFGRHGTRTSRHSIEAYRRSLSALLTWCATSGRQPYKLTTDDTARFKAWLSESGGLSGQPLSPASANARLAGAKAAVAALRWCGLGEKDPFADLKRVSNPTAPEEQGECYTRPEVEALLAAARTIRERALLLVFADGGLRSAEVADLVWKDPADTARLGVDLGARSARICGKGLKVRTIRLTARTVEALTEWRAVSETAGPGQPVFGRITKEGRVVKLTRQRLAAVVARLAKLAGVPRRGLHALRHFCGTELYRLTRDLKLVARHLGHADVSTASRYAHLADTDYEAAIDSLGNRPRAAA